MSETTEAPPHVQTHCGFCAIIGAPNAGKSTLVNQLTGSKVSIVSHKVQTTRARIRAIAMEGTTQIVLVDTPGIFKPRRKLDTGDGGQCLGRGGRCRCRRAAGRRPAWRDR